MQDDGTLVGSVRRSPVRMALFAVLPLVLAAAQVLNAALTAMDPLVGLGFAAAMVCYAVVYTRYHLAEDRLRVLEATTSPTAAD